METITFHCKVITPMFLAGADGRTPELRPPSIKGAMRFWWRAVNGHLELESTLRKGSKSEETNTGLRDQEALIFGGAGGKADVGRSSFSIQVEEQEVQTGIEKLVPHKGFTAECFLPGSTFKIKLAVQQQADGAFSVKAPVYGREEQIFSRDKLIALFQLTSLLGGLGRRVRRGMGSFEVTAAHSSEEVKEVGLESADLEGIHALLTHFSRHFSLDKGNGVVQNTYSGRMEKYPWIRQVQIGSSQSQLLQKISKAAHKLKKKAGLAYEPSLGHANRGRFASPVYVSALTGNKAVITTLNTIPDRNISLIDLNLQSEFKNRIL